MDFVVMETYVLRRGQNEHDGSGTANVSKLHARAAAPLVRRALRAFQPMMAAMHGSENGLMAVGDDASARDDSPGVPLTYDLSVPIQCRPEALFALLADIQDAEPIPKSAKVRMTKEPVGPTIPGTCWHERVRLAPGCWLSVESIVTDVCAPHSLELDFRNLWFAGHLTYTIESSVNGSVLHQREHLRPRGPLRWFSRPMDASLRPRLLRRQDDLRYIAENTER